MQFLLFSISFSLWKTPSYCSFCKWFGNFGTYICDCSYDLFLDERLCVRMHTVIFLNLLLVLQRRCHRIFVVRCCNCDNFTTWKLFFLNPFKCYTLFPRDFSLSKSPSRILPMEGGSIWVDDLCNLFGNSQWNFPTYILLFKL